MVSAELVAFTEESAGEEDSGYVENEGDFDFSRAIQDPRHSDIVIVPHLRSGQKFIISKSFQGSSILGTDNRPTGQKVQLSSLNEDLTLVDERNVHYATLCTEKGEPVRAHRTFKDAEILDKLPLLNHPHEGLIGSIV